MSPRRSWCEQCGSEMCSCLLDEEHEQSERGDEGDCMELVREAHRIELADLLARTGRPREEITQAIERTHKRSAA